jgi:hypothetical protein
MIMFAVDSPALWLFVLVKELNNKSDTVVRISFYSNLT